MTTGSYHRCTIFVDVLLSSHLPPRGSFVVDLQDQTRFSDTAIATEWS